MKKLALVGLSLATLTPLVNANDALWGALLGGIIGNQIGSSDHNQYIGAAIGAVIMGNENKQYHNQRPYHQGGYYTYVTRQVYVEPLYGYTDCGEKVLVRLGYYKTVTQRVWVP